MLWTVLDGSGEFSMVLDGFGHLWQVQDCRGRQLQALESVPLLWRSPARTLERSRLLEKAMEIVLETVLEMSEHSG